MVHTTEIFMGEIMMLIERHLAHHGTPVTGGMLFSYATDRSACDGNVTILDRVGAGLMAHCETSSGIVHVHMGTIESLIERFLAEHGFRPATPRDMRFSHLTARARTQDDMRTWLSYPGAYLTARCTTEPVRWTELQPPPASWIQRDETSR